MTGLRRGLLILGIAFLYTFLLWLGRNVALVSGPAALKTAWTALGRMRVEMVPLSPGRPQEAVQEQITVPTRLEPAAPPVPLPGPIVKNAGASALAASVSASASAGMNDAEVTVFNTAVPFRRVVYLIDVSGSMFTPVESKTSTAAPGRSRFDMAVEEVRRSVAALPSNVLFDVLIFGDRPVSMAPGFLPATPEAKEQALRFIAKVPDVGGGTNLVDGLAAAFNLGPDTVFLLTDGGANEPDWKLLREVQKLEEGSPVPSRIYAFGLAVPMDPDDTHLLQKLCRQCGGLYQSWDAAGNRWR